MSDGPRIVLEHAKFRIVEIHDGTKVMEKPDGADALGVERWKEIRFGDAEYTARMLRDWIYEHLGRCPTQERNDGANQ